MVLQELCVLKEMFGEQGKLLSVDHAALFATITHPRHTQEEFVMNLSEYQVSPVQDTDNPTAFSSC
jgi:hypothetical protein